MNIKMGYILISYLIITSGIVSGVPASPAPFSVSQPDNSLFQARQIGDEKGVHFETLDGYTIVKDENEWWNFAKLDGNLKLISTGHRVGKVEPETLGLPKHLQSISQDGLSTEQAKKQMSSATERILPQVFSPQVGTKKALVILINFSDKSQDPSHTPVYYNDLLFNASSGANSMTNYYKEVSYGKMDINGDVAGNRWFLALKNMSWYGSDVTKIDENTNDPDRNKWFISKLAIEAIISADPYVNYSDYDTNKDGIIDNLIIVHSGNGQETSGNSTDIWSHKGTIIVWDGSKWNSGFMTRDGVKAIGYTMQAESSPLGTFTHEFGHDIGLPDLYNTNNNLPGVGYWDLMGFGLWLDNGNTPGHLSAWSKYFLGWVKPRKVTASLINKQINQSETNDDVYMLLDNPGDSPGNLDWTPEGTGTGEYFLVENRRKTGYDVYLPGEGLLIWHLDETQKDNNNENRKLIDLEEADGRNDLDNGNLGDAFDPWYNNIAGFTRLSNPNSSLYNGSQSGIRITNISSSGPVMTANLLVGPNMSFVPPTAFNGTIISRNWVFVNVTSDEPLMTAELEWNGSKEALSGEGAYWYGNKTSLADGIYNFRVWGTNLGGKSNSTEMIIVTIDIQSPVVTINSPKDNSFVNTPDIFVNGTAKDDFGIIRGCIEFDGDNTCKYMENSTNFTVFNYSIALHEGSNRINIEYSDIAGNNGSASVNVTRLVTNLWPYVNVSVNTTANNVTEIDAIDEVNTTLELFTFKDTKNGFINIMMRNDIPPGINRTFPMTTLGKYIEINASDNLKNEIKSGWIIIKIYYTNAELKGLDENTLKISWYNNDSYPAHWEILSKDSPKWVHATGVAPADIKGFAGYVWANISHLSTFGMVGSYPSGDDGTSSGGGSGTTGGGGGGGGGASGENYTNIEVIEKYDLQISKDVLTSYRFTHEKNPIMFVNITGNTSIGIITTSTEVLKNTSTLVKLPPEWHVYKNVNIWVGTSGFATPKNIKEALIRFRVDSTWISSNNFEGSDIKLLRWDGSQWVTLETYEIDKDSTYTYFDGKTNAFSPFVISGLKEVTSEAAPIVTARVPTSVITAVMPVEAKRSTTNWAVIIGVLLVVGIVIVLHLQRKSR